MLNDLGALRTGMAGIVVVLLIAAPFALQPSSAQGVELLWTVVAPALFVIFLFVLPLDLIMTWVFMSGCQGLERLRLRRVLVVESALTGLLVLAWTPFIMNLLSLGR